jgi:hypothetical protein
LEVLVLALPYQLAGEAPSQAHNMNLKNGTIVLGSLVNGEEGYGRKVVYITEPVFFRALVVTTRHTLFRMVKFNVKVLRLKVQKN